MIFEIEENANCFYTFLKNTSNLFPDDNELSETATDELETITEFEML